MDTTYLQDQINAKEAEIADKQRRIDILKDGIAIDKKMLSILKAGLKKIQEKYADTEQEKGEQPEQAGQEQ